jgi:hypothetical protein
MLHGARELAASSAIMEYVDKARGAAMLQQELGRLPESAA